MSRDLKRLRVARDVDWLGQHVESHCVQGSPFYGLAESTRQQLVEHIKGWEGTGIHTNATYKRLTRAKDGLVTHPILLGKCEKLRGLVDGYAEYNKQFLEAELKHALKEEEKRKSLPRAMRIARGDLAEVSSFEEMKTNVFSLQLISSNHNLNPGELVQLTEMGPPENTEDDREEEKIKDETDGKAIENEENKSIKAPRRLHRARGIITKVNRTAKTVDVDCTGSSSDDESRVPSVVLKPACLYDVEIAFNTETYNRMREAIHMVELSKDGPLHLWMILFLESKYSLHKSFGPLVNDFHREAEDLESIISAQKTCDEVIRRNGLQPIENRKGNHVTVSRETIKEKMHKMTSLNDSQQISVIKSLTSCLSLVQGPPGCGKTHTAACIVKVWLETTSGKKALVLAQSNKAVDQLCSAMLKLSLKITRIGAAPKLQQNVKQVYMGSQLRQLVDFILDCIERNKNLSTDLEERLAEAKVPYDGKGYAETGYSKVGLLKEVIHNASVICTTCMGSRSKDVTSLLNPREVGLIVIDEASQASELECLVPLTAFPHAKIVMIGDHKQLPPTILSNEARKQGEFSLFSRLIEFGAPATEVNNEIGHLFQSSMLMTQYRMHPDISAFPNKHFYERKLSDGVVARDRPLPAPRKVWPWHGPRRGKSCVAYVEVTGQESQTRSKSFLNNSEVAAVVSASRMLLSGGLRRESLGVITPYSGQVGALKRAFQYANIPVAGKSDHGNTNSVEVNTVDAFQGSEKDVIIISTVRSNNLGSLGFLRDSRRMCVALTRAKRGLIVVGNPYTLEQDPNWKEWLKHHKHHQMKLRW